MVALLLAELVQTTALAGTGFAALALFAAGPALAQSNGGDGGAGGGNAGTTGAATGGRGGGLTFCRNGNPGVSQGAGAGGGGGGAPGGGAACSGGDGSNNPGSGGGPGQNGDPGSSNGQDGGGGGGGGDGGNHGITPAGPFTISTDQTGGLGGRAGAGGGGATTGFGIGGGGGGGGGAGGYGLIMNFGGTISAGVTVSGGQGGVGGDGGNGNTPTNTDGGGGFGGDGGDGGVGVYSDGSNALTLTNNGKKIQGGKGGDGGWGGAGSWTGSGGDGGRGGDGIAATNLTITNHGAIQGGDGGTAGSGGDKGVTDSAHDKRNGAGGAGGIGASGSSLTIDNSGTISGGSGADGGTRQSGYTSALDGGNGGDGGAGVAADGSPITNTGTIQGGDAGKGGDGLGKGYTNSGWAAGGDGGAGGHGITGKDLTIINSGTIAAGSGGAAGIGDPSGGTAGTPGADGKPINFTGGVNTLEIHDGSDIRGDVKAFSTADALRLGGSTDSTFDASQIGASAKYQGFGVFEKTDASTWTLSNTTTALTPWTISAGTLSIAADGALGKSTGVLTLDGGTLESRASFTSDQQRNVTITSNGGTFVVEPSTTLVWSGKITGNGKLTVDPTQQVAGTLVLTNDDNDYAGGTTISSATSLQIGNAGASGNIKGDVLNNGALDFNRTDTYAFAGKITGSGNVAQEGTGKLILSGANGYTGDTFIFGGTLSVASDGNLGSGGVLNLYSGTLENTRSFSSARAVSLNSGGGTFETDAALTLTGVISDDGSGVLTKSGSSSLTLTNPNNTYAGGTTINEGTLSVSSDGNLGTGGALTFNGGTLENTRSFSSARAVTINSANYGNLGFSGGSTFKTDAKLTLSDDITGDGKLTKSGSDTLVLTGGAGHTGGTAISDGTLQIGNGTAGSIGGDIAITSSTGTLVFGRTDGFTYGGKISGTAGNVEVAANSSLTLTGNSGFSGTTTIDTGASLQLGNNGTSGSIGGAIVNNGGLVFQRTDDALTLSNVISGAGTVTQGGSGTTTLKGDNSYKGVTNVNAGTLIIDGDQSAATGKTTVANNATLGGKGTIGGAVEVKSGGILLSEDSTIETDALTINGKLTVDANANLNYNYGASPTGAHDALMITVKNDVDLSGKVNISTENNVTLEAGIYGLIDHTGTKTGSGLTLGTTPSGEFSLQQNTPNRINLINATGADLHFWDPNQDGSMGGDGVWQSSAGNSNWTDAHGDFDGPYKDGSMPIFMGTAGTVTVDTSKGAVTVQGMQFAVGGYTITGDAVTLNSGDNTIRVGQGGPDDAGYKATIESKLTGAGKLVKSGAGTLILSATNNDYAGGTQINAGTLSVTSDGSLGQGSLSFNGGTLQNTAVMNSSRAVEMLANGGAFQTDQKLTLSGKITGAGALTKSGSDTLVLTNQNNDYQGGTNLYAGTISVASDKNLGDASGKLTFYGGTLSNTQGFTSGRDVVLNSGGGTFNTGGNQTGKDLTLTGNITGNGKLTKAGASTLTLTGNAGHTGGTTISQGALQIGNGGATGKIAGDITNNATLSFNRSGTLTVGGDIMGSGKVVQKGGGTTVLTGTNNYGGGTQITKGTLQLGDGSTTGSITGNVSVSGGATLAFDPSSTSALTVGGNITGGGTVVQMGGTTILTGTNSYGGGTQITAGTLQIGGGGTTGSITGNVWVANHATLAFNRSGPIALTIGGNITGDGTVKQAGSGTTVLTGTNNYHGGTEIARGTLQIGNGGTSGSITGDVDTDGTLAFDLSSRYVFGGDITGLGEVHQMGGGTTVLTGTSGYHGGTTISGGTLQIGNGAAAGSITGVVTNNGTLAFNRSDDSYSFGGVISGSGDVVQMGSGTTTLTGKNRYKGTTQVRRGTLVVNGDQSAATGKTTVFNGGTLAGKGTLGGDVAVNSSGTLSVKDDGSGTATKLSVGGGLSLAHGSGLDYEYGLSPSGNGNNALMVDVTGDLALDGTINVKTDPGVILAPGVYGLIDYGGNLTSKNFAVGQMPPGDFEIQTAIAHKVNLVNSTGMNLHFWDPSQDGSMEGGDGVWQAAAGNTNWTDSTGTDHGGFTDDSFAIFHGQTGTVTVDDSKGTVRVGGMQFAVDGYIVEGDSITLGADETIIRVGDSSPISEGHTATIHSKLIGAGKLVKKDLGTLVLTGANGYTGGTEIEGGTLNVSADGNLGARGTKITIDGGTLQFGGAFDTARNVTLGSGNGVVDTMGNMNTLRGTIDGAGKLTKEGSGTLTLSGANSFSGGLTVDEGTVRAGAADKAFGSGQLTVSKGATADLAGFSQTVGGLAGAGSVALGNGTLTSTQAGKTAFSGILSGAGGLSLTGSGKLTLSGANRYKGATQVRNGTLIVNRDQSAATGKTTVSDGGTLTGKGTLGGDVAVNDTGTLAIADDGNGTTRLAIEGGLSLAGGSKLDYDYGVSPNGNHDALMVDVAGDLALDGTINVKADNGVTFAPGVYGLIHYGGDLTSQDYAVGTLPSGDFQIQTAIAHRVNLVNATDVNLHFWDPSQNGRIEGGSGVWQAAAGNANWTDSSGTDHGGFSDDGFAVFHGKPGTVTVDESKGAVRVSGMQFAVDGYVVKGDGITLGTDPATIRVGDGSAAGASFMATILSDLSGDAKLVKADHGTLVLAGNNSYTGGTEIDAGTLNVSKDANLGESGTKITIDGGTLQFGSSFDTDRDVTIGSGDGIIDTGGNSNTLNGVIDGTGALTKEGSGLLTLTGKSTYGGPTTIAAGRLAVDGSTSSAVTVTSQGILSGTGTVGDVTNEGLVAPGSDTKFGTLTVDGNYTGKQGRLSVNTYLADDTSPTDQLHVTGATFGDTTITVHNAGGPGAQTVEGIRIVDVDGASKGTFTLDGHYEAINGEQGIVAGAFTYTLNEGSFTYPDDGDWYLRSHLTHEVPHFQPGVPLYSVYEQVLTRLNTAASLRARMGGRSWMDDAGAPIVTAAIMPETSADSGAGRESVLWGRISADDGHYVLDGSTTGNAYDLRSWRLEAGLDMLLRETDAGQLLGGVWLKTVDGQADVSSPFGTGRLDTTGYGVAAALTWFGHDGIYADAQAHANWYETDIISHNLGRTLGRNEDAFGYVLSLEAGRRIALDANWSVTPQAQLTYAALDTEDLRHDFGADVFLNDNDSLTARLGLAVNYDTVWRTAQGEVRQASLSGLANIHQQFIDQAQTVDISGARLATGDDGRTWGEIGLGGTYRWQGGKYGVHGNVMTAGSLENFADSYSFGGELGFNIKW